jgi:TRAP-type C4-dicarboxylate transport system permease small subunit
MRTTSIIRNVECSFERLSSYMYKVAYVLSAALVTIMLFSMTTQVFCRYVLNNPLLWPEELARLSMVWLCFIGGSIALKKGLHVSFTLIVDRLSVTVRRYIGLSCAICISIFTLSGFIVGLQLFFATTRKSPSLYISYSWLKLGMVIGFGLMFIHIIYFVLNYLGMMTRGNSEKKTEQITS